MRNLTVSNSLTRSEFRQSFRSRRLRARRTCRPPVSSSQLLSGMELRVPRGLHNKALEQTRGAMARGEPPSLLSASVSPAERRSSRRSRVQRSFRASRQATIIRR
jgi:hypothetical protein